MDCRAWLRKVKGWLSLITVEPTMVLYMMAFMITSVVESAFYVDKACRVNHHFDKSICDDITADENEDYNKKVQATVSEFNQWNDIAGHAFPVVLALFMGAWSDRRGRKLPLLLGLIGKLYWSIMIVVNSTQDTWPLEYVIYTATLPMCITGADVAIFAAAYAYIADITTSDNRTMRVTILEVFYLTTMPTGTALGRWLYSDVVNKSYTVMFSINASMMFLAVMYTLIVLNWLTTDTQKSIFEARNIFVDFFDYNHVVQTIRTLVKWRPKHRRRFLILLIVSMGFYSFQRDEKHTSYLYYQLALKWTFDQISNFRTYQSAVQDAVLLVMVPLLSKYFSWRDTSIMMLGALFHSIARLFFANAHVGWLIYFGGLFSAVGPIVAPVIRSMVSKLVAANERGKAFAMLSVTDNAIPLLSGMTYNQVYQASMHNHPASIFYVTIGTQMTVFFIALYMHFKADNSILSQEPEKRDTTESIESDSDLS